VHHIGEVVFDHGLTYVHDLEVVLYKDLVTGNSLSGLFVTVITLNF